MEPPHRATQRPIVLSLFELSPASFVIAFVTPLVSESRLAVGARVLFSISISPRSSPSSSATRKILGIKGGRNCVCRHQWREEPKKRGQTRSATNGPARNYRALVASEEGVRNWSPCTFLHTTKDVITRVTPSWSPGEHLLPTAAAIA